MGSSRRGRQASRQTPETARPEVWLERITLAGCTALTVFAVLIPSEAAIPEGSFAPLAAGWCLLWGLKAASLWLAPAPRIPWGWTELGVVALVLWHTLAAMVHLGQGNDRQTLHALWLVLGYGVALLLWRQILRSPAVVHATLLVMLWLATTLAGWGLFQTAYSLPRLRREYAQNPTRLLAEQGLPAEAGSPQRELFENRLQSTEPLASFALTNSLAGFLAPWCLMAVWLAADLRQNATLRLAFYTACFASTLVGVCLLLTKSRTAYLAVAIGLLLMSLARGYFPTLFSYPQEDAGSRSGAPPISSGTLLGGRLTKPTSLFGWLGIAGGTFLFLVLVAGAAAAGWLDWKVLAEAPVSVRYRLEYWQATCQMIREHPLWGCGPGNFQSCYAHYKLPQASEMVADPHNLLLEVAATAGLPALAFLLATLGAFVYDLGRLLRRPAELSGPDVSGLALAGDPRFPRADSRAWDRSPSPPTAYVFVGACAGLLGAVPLAWVVGFNLETWLGMPVAWWLGMPLLAFLWYFGHTWPEKSAISVAALLLSLLVLSLHLQAAGGWMFPGVMTSYLVLVPAALAAAELGKVAHTTQAATQPSRGVSSGSSPTHRHVPPAKPVEGGLGHGTPVAAAKSTFLKISLTAVALALALASLVTEYYPTLQARVAVEQAEALWQSGRFEEAEQQLVAASKADPRHPQPWELLAELRLARWLREPSDAAYAALIEAVDGFTRRDPQNHMAWYARGTWFLRAWSKSRSNKDLESAIQAYTAAARHYPNRALYHGQLAWVLYAAGQHDLARQEAERAWALDQQMAHREQKLHRQKILTIPIEGGATPSDPARLVEEPAEQTVQWLRKLSVKPTERDAKREGAQ